MLGIKGVMIQAKARLFSSRAAGAATPGCAVAEVIQICAAPKAVVAGTRRPQLRKNTIKANNIKELFRRQHRTVCKLRANVRRLEYNQDIHDYDFRYGIGCLFLFGVSGFSYLDKKILRSANRRGF
jgi:hypothetical protein